MINCRVTKYNPVYRDIEGRYLKEEWTSSADIWNASIELSIKEYVETEDEYWKVISNFLQLLFVESMSIVGLEVYGTPNLMSKELKHDSDTLISSLSNGKILSVKDELEDVFRLCMREIIWCKLIGDNNTFIHFGYDYYVYFGTQQDISLTTISTPLFIEECESPYITA